MSESLFDALIDNINDNEQPNFTRVLDKGDKARIITSGDRTFFNLVSNCVIALN